MRCLSRDSASGVCDAARFPAWLTPPSFSSCLGIATLHCRFACVLALLTAVGGCDRPAPAGQVLARVDGTDVTRRDVAAELQAGGASGMNAALGHVIDRRLLVRVAQEQGLERTPDFLAGIRRAREELLVQLLVRRMEGTLPPPGVDAVARYVAANPNRFADRAIVTVARLRAGAGAAAIVDQALTVDAAAAALAARGIAADVTRQTLDTADLTPADAAALADARGGALVRQEGGAGTQAWQVLSYRAAPLPAGRAGEAARMATREEQLTAQTAAIIDRERRAADIRYHAGYGPAAR